MEWNGMKQKENTDFGPGCKKRAHTMVEGEVIRAN
jgi:hypothetical protein